MKILRIVAVLSALIASPSLAQISQDAVVGSSGGGGITALTGDCVASGTGSVATTCGFEATDFVANYWYLPFSGSANTGAQASPVPVSTITCFYGAVVQKVTIGALAVGLTTLAASGNVQAAMYTSVNGRPGSLLSSTASMSTTTTGTLTASLAANKQVGPGGSDGGPRIWWCTNLDATAGGTAKFMAPYANNSSNTGQATLIGSSTAANIINKFSASTGGVQCAGAACNGGSSTFGTWPTSLVGSTWTDISSNNSVALVAFQPASIP